MMTYRKGIAGWTGIGVFLINAALYGQTDVTIGKEFAIQSSILNEERKYFIRLPASYENDANYPNKKYPVLLLLDADSHFYSLGGLIHGMSVSDEQIPEMIVVGVRNTNRSRDMTPGSQSSNDLSNDKKFRRFIEEELLKEIDRRYRTLPFRVLVGHSLAGLFALNCFLDQSSFNAYLSIDPTMNVPLFEKAEQVLKNKSDFRATIYFIRANNPFQDTSKGNERFEGFKKFVAYLADNPSTGLRSESEFFENEDHFSVVTIAVYQGLQFVFQGYKPVMNLFAGKTTAEVIDYYLTFQKRLGAEILPPGKLIDQVGVFLLREKKPDQAIALLKVNEHFYPNAFVTHKSLGDAFKAQGNNVAAKRYYTKALEIDPNNEKVRKALDELNKQ